MLENRFPVHGHLIRISITITGVDHYPGNNVSSLVHFAQVWPLSSLNVHNMESRISVPCETKLDYSTLFIQ